MKKIQLLRHLSIVGLLILLSSAQKMYSQSITSFSPTYGPVGTVVTITGTGFDATAANNIVYVGGVVVTVSAATTTSLTITIRAGAATTAKLIVINTVTHKQANSSASFNITSALGGSHSIAAGNFATTNTFTSVSNSNSPGSMRNVMCAADLDGDGKPDVVSVAPSSIGILRNTNTGGSIGVGTFAAVTSYATPGSSYNIALADMNNDGKLDIVVGNSGNVSVFINQSTSGTISFAAAQNITVTSGSILRLADIDGDGNIDIISAANYATTAYILRNTTSGGSSTVSFAAAFSLSSFGSAMDFTVADMNKDGKPDIVAVNSSSLNVFINSSTSGSISFNAAVNVTGSISGASYTVMCVEAGDLDRDGDPDLIVGNNGTTSSVIFTNNYSSGSFIASNLSASVFTVGGGGQFSNMVSIQDLDGDGKPEIIMENSNSANNYILQNNYSTGSLSASNFGANVSFYSLTPLTTIAVDLNNDGKPELVSAQYFSANMIVYSNAITLPITLLNFEGSNIATGNKIDWQSTNNQGVTNYTVERLNALGNFEALKTISDFQSVSSEKWYSYTDLNPLPNVNQYRLKQISPDGNIDYSKTISLLSKNTAEGIQLYPNPARSSITINNLQPLVDASFRIYNMNSVLLTTIHKKNATSIVVDVSAYLPGSYIVQVIRNNVAAETRTFQVSR